MASRTSDYFILPLILALAFASRVWTHRLAGVVLLAVAAGLMLLIVRLFQLHQYLQQTNIEFDDYVFGVVFLYIASSLLFSAAYLASVEIGGKIGSTDPSLVFYNGSFVSSFFHSFYFSIITGLSLGYGDFYPVEKWTRLVSMTNVLFGPLFLVGVFTIAVTASRDTFKDRGRGLLG